MTLEQLGQRIALAYYVGSDGPRVLLLSKGPAGVSILEDVFRKVSSHCVCNLGEHPSIYPLDTSLQVTMILAGDATKRSYRRLKKVSENALLFEWELLSSEWAYLADLVGALAATSVPCHQYLTEYPRDDAVVVVSKGEYSGDLSGLASRDGY